MKISNAGKVAIRAVLVIVVVVVLGPLGWKLATANMATVVSGHVYRSGQMGAAALGGVVREKKIRTVLNLRGAHPEEAWYRQERAAVLAQGATQIDLAMSSCEWMSKAQLRALVRVLDTCEYPILIHCWRGAERTGLVSAFTELLRPGGSLDSARGQFSVAHLFVPLGDGALMPVHLDRYEAWLHAEGLSHSPAAFRRWVAEGFQPGMPSRDAWPYDPYPLVVVTRPQSLGNAPFALLRPHPEPAAAPSLRR
jgi:protein tyrosine phosphatase (PTP) superfamily phosphohydrolase (DUF442 family)